MTSNAIEAVRADRAALIEICGGLTAADWKAESGCPGWSVQDVVAHIAVTFWQLQDPSQLPGIGTGLPIERANDAYVESRRSWDPAKVLADYEDVSIDALDHMGTLVTLDLQVPIEGLGTYPASVLPSAWAFDHYTHIRADLFGPRGPLAGPPPPGDELRIGATLDWIEAALPQQNPQAATACELDLQIQGAGARTITFGASGGTPKATVLSPDAMSFVRWITQRGAWDDLGVQAAGDEAAVALASELRVF
jgi:uncharacterized protein (TIGR03083 family)